jgi:CHAT domain-containing protein
MLHELSPRLDTSESSCDTSEERMDLFEASSFLYDALISPFDSELRKEQALQIYCHDQRLNTIPWAALSASMNATPLFQQYRLSIIPDACGLIEPSKINTESKLVNVQSLETKEDLNTLQQNVQRITVSSFKELNLTLSQENCIQLSLDIPTATELQLADSKIEISGMFKDTDLSHISLVILDSENSTDMAKALVLAGVKSVIHPLWKLPKTAIRELVSNISSNLESMDPISALQDAQMKQKNGKKFADSSFWSAWIAIVSLFYNYKVI